MKIKENNYLYDKRVVTSSKFLLANGYYGYRGTLSEDTSKDMVVWNLNGIYDQVGEEWRESINAFNPLYTFIEYKGNKLHPHLTEIKNHLLSLDLETGLLLRRTTFIIGEAEIEIESRRFADQNNINLIHEEYEITATKPLNIELYQGIDLNIFDISGKHIERVETQIDNDILSASGITQENKIPIQVISRCKTNFNNKDLPIKDSEKVLHHYSLEMQPHKIYRLSITAGVSHSNSIQKDALKQVVLESNFNDAFKLTKTFWKNKWDISDVQIKGNEEANKALKYDIFQLIAHRPYDETVSIPARGLSGQVYKGAVFWDTEVYMFLFFLLNDIESAKNILKYRINGLSEAIKKAKDYGFKGAFYAWESQENGFDACSDYNLTDPITKEPVRTYFKELQIHINGAIIYALDHYLDVTNDYDLLKTGALNMLIEINRFYSDYLTLNPSGQYECLNVIGPDEYHEHVNNNAYTNYLIHFCMKKMDDYLDILKTYDNKFYQTVIINNQDIIKKAKDIQKNIKLPQANKNGIIQQFDGYLELEDSSIEEVLSQKKTENEYLGGENGLASNTQIIKQADVILLLVLFPKLFSKKIQKKNYEYYKQRTEHGSSLSKAIYSILASRINYPDEAYSYFINGANIDLTGNSKQYAGGIYIGGNHLAAYGGAYMATVLGFLGYDNKDHTINKQLPKEIKDIEIQFQRRGFDE